MPCQDNAATHAVDDVSASNNNGTLQVGNSSAYHTTGPGGTLTGAVYIPEGGDSILLGSPITLAANANWTVEVFLKDVPNDGNDHAIMGDGVGDGLSSINIKHDGTIKVQDFGGSSFTQSKASEATISSWNHFAIVGSSDGSSVLYLNGTSVGTMTGTRTADIIISSLVNDQGLTADLGASIAGLKIYSTARTQPQIAADYAEGVTATSSTSTDTLGSLDPIGWPGLYE